MEISNYRPYHYRTMRVSKPSPWSDIEYWHSSYYRELVEIYRAFSSAVIDMFPDTASYWNTNDAYTDFIRMLYQHSSRYIDGFARKFTDG